MADDDNIIDVEAEEIEENDDPSKGKAIQRWRPAQYSEEWWQWVSPEIQANRCQAHSSRTGLRCRRPAIAGGRVCRAHGGAAKHVKQAARARLDNAADSMVKRLLQLAQIADDPVALRAVDSALDRTLGKPVQAIAVGHAEPKPWEEVFEGISDTSRAESRRARGLPDTDDVLAGFASNTTLPSQHTADSDGSSVFASAGEGESSSNTPQYGSRPESDEHSELHSQSGPPRQPRPRDPDRDRHAQPAARHISGDAAYEVSGQLHRQLAIESPHKRYRRP